MRPLAGTAAVGQLGLAPALAAPAGGEDLPAQAGQAGRGRAAPASPGKAPRDRPPAALADPPPTAPNPLYALSARDLVANGTIVLRSLGQEIPLDEIYA